MNINRVPHLVAPGPEALPSARSNDILETLKILSQGYRLLSYVRRPLCRNANASDMSRIALVEGEGANGNERQLWWAYRYCKVRCALSKADLEFSASYTQ